jgi:hypothetical protein
MLYAAAHAFPRAPGLLTLPDVWSARELEGGPGHVADIRRPARSRRRSTDADIAIVEAEARYHRDRLALYRARVLSAKPTSSGRLRELERNAAAAETRKARIVVPAAVNLSPVAHPLRLCNADLLSADDRRGDKR